MARKYECNPGRYAWNLEQCEEEVFIAAFVFISDSIRPNQDRSIKHFFFELGKGLAFEDLNEINTALKSQGLEPIEFRETEIGEYARSRDEQMKSQRRKQVHEEFAKANSELLAEGRARASAEVKRLPSAHVTYEEFKLRKLQQGAVAPLGQGDIARTPSTWRAGDAPEVIPIGTRPEKHAKFQRLLPGRTDEVLTAIHRLANLSSQNYEFEEAEVEKIFDTIQHRVEEARERFRRRLTKRSRR